MKCDPGYDLDGDGELLCDRTGLISGHGRCVKVAEVVMETLPNVIHTGLGLSVYINSICY